MKLLHKNIIINALASLLIILLGGVITYFFIVDKVKDESEEHLLSEKHFVESKLKQGESPEQIQKNIGDLIQIEEIPALRHTKYFFTKVAQKEEINEEDEDEAEFEAQAIVFDYSVSGKYYTVTIIKSYDNDEALGKNITDAVTLSAFLMIIAIVLINTFIYRKIWAPFYYTLRVLKNFNISKQNFVTLIF